MRFSPTLLFCLATVVSLAQSNPKQHVDARQAEALLKKSPEIVVLDVRTQTEYKQGHVANAKNIDFRNPAFASQLATLDKNKTYLIHCALGVEGGRSRRSLRVLDSLGIKNVIHLDGGMDAWQKANLPVVK